MMNRIWRSRDERGAILLMATVGVVLAIVAAALAVDLGRIAEEKRRNQKVADLAALDAARDITNVQALAEASAARNGFPSGPGYSVVAIEGSKVDGECVAVAGVGKACVTVSSPLDNLFQPGGRTVVARAVAGRGEEGGFTEGSTLASANLDNELPILNGIISEWIGATGNVNLVSYQGLAQSYVKVRDLQTQLGFGTVNELLNADLTLAELLTATAVVLNNQGTVASIDAATKTQHIANNATNSQQFTLGEYIKVAQGYENKAAEVGINVLQLIVSTAQLANGENLVDAGSLISLPVPGVGTFSTNVKVKVIEGPKTYIGPEGGPNPPLHTGQVELTLTPYVDVNFTAYGLLTSANLRIVGDLPVKFEAAGADGTLTDVRCSSPQGESVRIVSLPITTSSSADLRVYDQGALLSLLNVRADVSVDPTPVATSSQTTDLDFSYPTEFTPPATGKTTPGAPVGVDVSRSSGKVTATVGVLGLPVGITLANVLDAVVDPILVPTVNSVVNRVATPALKALGIAIGPVDVAALADAFNPSGCGQPALQG